MITGVIYSALQSLVSGRCYPSRFPQDAIGAPGTSEPALSAPVWPAIRYTIVDAQNEPTICGTDSVETDDTRIQIDVVALTHGGMLTIRDQVIAALSSIDPPCFRENYFETWDAETKTHRGILLYVAMASSAAGGSP